MHLASYKIKQASPHDKKLYLCYAQYQHTASIDNFISEYTENQYVYWKKKTNCSAVALCSLLITSTETID